MSHKEQTDFIKNLKSKYQQFFTRKKVLEIGSLNINGTIRDLFYECDYIGIDLDNGPGVDIICEGQNYDAPDESYDVVISTECFEHNPYWYETFLNMIRLCKPEGFVVFTCATEGREEHGTTNRLPSDSPFTVLKGWNYYKNLTENDFIEKIDFSKEFDNYSFSTNNEVHDLYFCGIKKSKEKYENRVDNNMNFVKIALESGGDIKPLLIPSADLLGPSLTNPSVLVVNDVILVNLRNVNYTLYHSELNIFEHVWGPLVYIHPENDLHLRTTNYILELDDNLDVIHHSIVDTSDFDTYQPQWEFVGLEDVRLVNWNDKIYGIGVRRDLDTVGTGRMELSEFEFNESQIKEVSRYRIPGPPPDDEYCMKNCTPIQDKPFHLLKWTNPTALMKFNPDGSDSEVYTTTELAPGLNDMRGGSQVIKWKDGYLTLVHETQLYKSEQGKKNATYRHRFVSWDSEFKNQKFSKLFSFMDMKVEFCCGLAEHKDDLLITFGAQDNMAYILRASKSFIEEFINE